MAELQLQANAKINLFLEVLDKRADGYHNIETVFQSIDLYDTIIFHECEPGVVRINCDHPEVPLDASNLVYKAADLLLKESGANCGVEIHITKRIPVGAGLGGGSADAAATLVGLNELWGLGKTQENLRKLGSRLGADVPFCIIGGTALGRGRGDVLTQLPQLPETPVVVANPGFQVSTAWAYGSLGLTSEKKNANILIGKIRQGDLSGIGDELFNVFESVVMRKYPVVRGLKENLIRSGALGVLMTGSGPTVFALARDISDAQRICEQAKQIASFCVVTKTSTASIVRSNP